MSDYQDIRYTVEDKVATITLNRPDVLNSFDGAMGARLQQILSDLRENEACGSVVLTGAGRAFCAGQDLDDVKPVPGETPRLGEIVRGRFNPIVTALRELPRPVVCGVNGVAAGAGANLAFACDIIFASAKAVFIQSFCKVGLVPDTGGTWFIPRTVGLSKAAELMMLGDRITAEEALRLGLVSRVVDPDDLASAVRETAAQLANAPTYGIGLIKQALNQTFANTLEQQLELEAELQDKAGRSSDYAEGVDAFVNKREPKFTGR